jgi:hypothetical protein
MGWTRKRKKWAVLLACIGTAGVVTVLLLLQLPISEERSGYTMIGWQVYTFEAVNIFRSPSANFTYGGVTFEFLPSDCAQNPGGGNICGSVLQSNGLGFSFDLALPPSCHGLGAWLSWVSPNRHEAIEIEICANSQPTHLLVAA